jgi:hypothetical protein
METPPTFFNRPLKWSLRICRYSLGSYFARDCSSKISLAGSLGHDRLEVRIVTIWPALLLGLSESRRRT